MCLSTGTLLGPLHRTFVVPSRVKPIHWLADSTDHSSSREFNSYSTNKLLNIYDNVHFLHHKIIMLDTVHRHGYI
jgi:hypothetical protein